MIFLLTALVFLNGCANPVYRTKLEIFCPSMQQYSDEFNAQLADELDTLPNGYDATFEAIKGYIYLRDKIRRCEKERDNL